MLLLLENSSQDACWALGSGDLFNRKVFIAFGSIAICEIARKVYSNYITNDIYLYSTNYAYTYGI